MTRGNKILNSKWCPTDQYCLLQTFRESKWTQHFSIRTISWLITFTEIIVVCS